MNPVEVVTAVQRRRRWTAEQKKDFVLEAEQPGMNLSAVARKYGLHPNQLFRRRRLMHEGDLNRRVRTLMPGGVGGRRLGGLPLSRFTL